VSAIDAALLRGAKGGGDGHAGRAARFIGRRLHDRGRRASAKGLRQQVAPAVWNRGSRQPQAQPGHGKSSRSGCRRRSWRHKSAGCPQRFQAAQRYFSAHCRDFNRAGASRKRLWPDPLQSHAPRRPTPLLARGRSPVGSRRSSPRAIVQAGPNFRSGGANHPGAGSRGHLAPARSKKNRLPGFRELTSRPGHPQCCGPVGVAAPRCAHWASGLQA